MGENNWSLRTQTRPQQHVRFERLTFATRDIVNAQAPAHCLSFTPAAYFLSLSPDGANRTTADLISPVFIPTQTCQVTSASTKTKTWYTWYQPHEPLFTLIHQMSFYYYVGATHGDLQVLVQTHPLGQSTVTWKNSEQPQTGTWLQTVIHFSSNYSFQVCNIQNLPSQQFSGCYMVVQWLVAPQQEGIWTWACMLSWCLPYLWVTSSHKPQTYSLGKIEALEIVTYNRGVDILYSCFLV